MRGIVRALGLHIRTVKRMVRSLSVVWATQQSTRKGSLYWQNYQFITQTSHHFFFFLPYILPRNCQVHLKHLSNTPCLHSSQLISCNRNRNTAQADRTEEKTLSAPTGLGKFKAISIEAYKVVQFLFFIRIIIIIKGSTAQAFMATVIKTTGMFQAT